MSENLKKKEFKKVYVEGIAMYASVHKPKKGFTDKDVPQYCLDLIVDKANAKKLLDEGLKVAKYKVDEDTKKPKRYESHPTSDVFNLRKKTIKADGSEATPPQVVDSNLNPIPPTTLIGNGSKVLVSISPYTIAAYGTKSHTLLGVQVLDLVPYTSNSEGSSAGFKPKDGFTVDTTVSTSDNDEMPF